MARTATTTRKAVGARELKTRLGKYLRAVRNGTTITITDRGVPVASLTPLSIESKDTDAVLDELEAEGILSKGSGGRIGEGVAIKVRGEPIERTIARDRDDRL